MKGNNMSKPLALTALLTVMVLGGLAGCERKGPAERTGEAIDDAARSTQEQFEETGEDIRDCVNDPDGC